MITVVAAIIRHDGQILICQRRRDKSHALKWEFPGGKVEAGESFHAALGRELGEELGISPRIGAEVYRTQYKYPEQSGAIEIVFCAAQVTNADAARLKEGITNRRGASLNAFEKVTWVAPAALRDYDFLAANSELIAKLAEGTLRLE
jgi:8-oxo-dGTP diphosphatase